MFTSKEITNILKCEGKTPGIDIITVEGITHAHPHDGYRIDDPIPPFRFDGSYYDSILAMDYYAPQLKNRIARNVLTNDLLGDTSLWKGSETSEFKDSTGIYKPIDDTIMNKICSKVQSMINPIQTDRGFKSITPKPEHIMDHMNVIGMDRPPINPFTRLFKEPPSMVDCYLPEIFLESCGAVFPAAEIDPEENAIYVRNGSLGLFLSLIELQETETGESTEMMPIFIGQWPGGQGKSTLCRKLAIRNEYFANWRRYPQDRRELYYKSYGKVIIELDEKCGMGDVETLKSDISVPVLTFDKKYKGTSDLIRRFFFIMTTNDYSVVKEDNRRFFPIEFKNPEKKYIFGDAITEDRMRSVYWVAKKYYDEGRRSADVLKEISSLSSKARRTVEDSPIAAEYIKEWVEETDPEGATDKMIKGVLENTAVLSTREKEAGLRYWKSIGFSTLGFRKVPPGENCVRRKNLQTVRYTYLRK